MTPVRFLFLFLLGAGIVAAPLFLVPVDFGAAPPPPVKTIAKGQLRPPEDEKKKFDEERKKREEEERKKKEQEEKLRVVEEDRRKEEQRRHEETQKAIADLQKKLEDADRSRVEESRLRKEEHRREMERRDEQARRALEELQKQLEEARRPRADPELARQIEQLKRELAEAKKPPPAPAPVPPRPAEAAPELVAVRKGPPAKGSVFMFLDFKSLDAARSHGFDFAVATSDGFVTHVVELDGAHRVKSYREFSRDDRSRYADISFGFRDRSVAGLREIESAVAGRFESPTVKLLVDRVRYNNTLVPLVREARDFADRYGLSFEGVRMRLFENRGAAEWAGVYADGKFYPKP